jgi:hypothetical protein
MTISHPNHKPGICSYLRLQSFDVFLIKNVGKIFSVCDRFISVNATQIGDFETGTACENARPSQMENVFRQFAPTRVLGVEKVEFRLEGPQDVGGDGGC